MPFTEEQKLNTKKKSHFQCCLCHGLGVEIHHIIPQADLGPDTEDNAAPLCPSCHETYGANPQKRKFIREARDFWYELCSRRYASDSAALSDLKEKLDQTASKTDLAAITDVIERLLNPKTDHDLISIELPVKYWIVVMGALEPLVKTVEIQLKELKTQKDPQESLNELPNETISALTGVIISRGTIIDALVAKGIMRPQAGRMGVKHLMNSLPFDLNNLNQNSNKKNKN
jgi:hypothetical protein